MAETGGITMRPLRNGNAIYRTRRLVVRPLTLDDISGNYSRWFSDQEVCRCNSHGVFPQSAPQLETYVRASAKTKDRIVWAIVDSKTGCHVGNISLQDIDPINRSAELAVIIGEKSYWGKGYAFEASALLLKHGFTKVNVLRIYCGTAATNIGMQKVALKLGMKREGKRRKALYLNGTYVDLLEYGILKSEFAANV